MFYYLFLSLLFFVFFFFFQAEDGIRDWSVTGVQTCALPIFCISVGAASCRFRIESISIVAPAAHAAEAASERQPENNGSSRTAPSGASKEIGRASCRERVEISVVGGALKKKKDKIQQRTRER